MLQIELIFCFSLNDFLCGVNLYFTYGSNISISTKLTFNLITHPVPNRHQVLLLVVDHLDSLQKDVVVPFCQLLFLANLDMLCPDLLPLLQMQKISHSLELLLYLVDVVAHLLDPLHMELLLVDACEFSFQHLLAYLDLQSYNHS